MSANRSNKTQSANGSGHRTLLMLTRVATRTDADRLGAGYIASISPATV